jgi:hypothetical protein
MFPGGIERALGIAEISEWFDWMRRHIPDGGLALPLEETAVSFAGHALRLRDRIRDISRHVPISLENRLIEATIVYQCWKLQKDLYSTARWPEVPRCGSLATVEAKRYIRPLGDNWGYHLVEGHDGLLYVITVPSGFASETVPATEVICNRLLRLLGLTVSDAAVVVVKASLIGCDSDVRAGRQHAPTGRAPELCAGFRYVDSSLPDASRPSRLVPRNVRDLVGALILDIWTLNLSTRGWSSAFSETTGRVGITMTGNNGGLAGGDWQRFLGSTSTSPFAIQTVAPEVKRLSQIQPWIRSIRQLDLNPIWELVFRMPPQWYGGQRKLIAGVLDKLESRKWGLQSTVRDLIGTGCFPSLNVPPSRVDVTFGAWRRDPRRTVRLESIHHGQLAE